MAHNAELYGSVYEKGEIVFRQGEPGETMFIIQYGAVEVSHIQNGHESVLAILEKRSFFGEMALIDNRPRSATVKTLCRCRLLSVSKESLLKRIQKDPGVALYLLEILIQRIERTNRLLHARMDQSSGPDVDPISMNGMSPGKDTSLEASDGDENHLHKEIMHKLINMVSKHELKTFEPGQIIFRMGDSCDAMYIISEGLVEISLESENESYILASLGRNDVFGEMCLVKSSTRTATATVKETTRTICIKCDVFMTSLEQKPELAFCILQIMIIRLRRSMNALHHPSDYYQSEPNPARPIIKKKNALTMNLISLSACSGCMLGLLQEETHLTELLDRAVILYSPLLIDKDEMDFADIAVVDGGIRTDQEKEKLQNIREKCRFLISWGTCATFGGIPILANHFEIEDLIEESYGHTVDPFSYYLSGLKGAGPESYADGDISLLRKAGRADDFVKVDYYLPGCPPPVALLIDVISEIEGRQSNKPSKSTVCSECIRKPFSCPSAYEPYFHQRDWSGTDCFNKQGILCLGFLTRGGCEAICTRGGLPCWACRGPSAIALSHMKAGNSLEMILIDLLSERCTMSSEPLKLTSAMQYLRDKGNSLLSLDHSFLKNSARLR